MRTATPLDQPRAIGHAQVSSKSGLRGSCINGLRQSGALKVLFPRNPDTLEAVFINTAGGITGGDTFNVNATAGTGSSLTLTTQAAERVYGAQPDQVARVNTHLKAEAGSQLRWLPQESILFQNAALRRKLTVDLDEDADFLMVEPLLFGRRAMGESLSNITFQDRIIVRHAGQIVYCDGINLIGDAARQMARPGLANGATAMASLLWISPQAAGRLNTVRELLGDNGGASLLRDDILVLRTLGEDGFALRQHLIPVLDLLTDNTLPQSWRL